MPRRADRGKRPGPREAARHLAARSGSAVRAADRGPGPRAAVWPVAACFALGLILRVPAFTGAHVEGDEVIYHGLVAQMDAGRGYHLVGLDLADEIFPGEQFSQRLFYHPPAGPAFFWLLWKLLGETGFGAAQLASYIVFFFALRAFAARVLGVVGPAASVVIAALAAATPIVTHVQTKHWLDGPVLAMVTVAAVVWADAFRSRSPARAAGAGALLGVASLIKTTAFVALPGLLLLAWALQERRLPDRRWWWCALVAVAVPLAVQAPWELWQWIELGSPFPYWAGRPVERLVSENPYIWFVTVKRSPWVYLQLLPICVWSSLPVLLVTLVAGPSDPRRRVVMALVAWAAVVVAAHVLLGARGYSKLLRYVILITPAMVALAAWAAERVMGGAGRPPLHPALRTTLLVVLVTGFGLEVVQGIATAFGDPALHMVVSLADSVGLFEQP